MKKTTRYFYFKNVECLKKYGFNENSEWKPKYYFLTDDINIVLEVRKDTLEATYINRKYAISVLCEAYKNGDVLITNERNIFSEEQKEKLKVKMEKEIDNLKARYKEKYGIE